MMRRLAAVALFCGVTWGLGASALVACDISDPTDSIALSLQPGRILRLALDERVRVKRVGQPVSGTLVEPVFSYDRAVLPAGIKVTGRVEKLQNVSKGTRLRAALRGDLTPVRGVTLVFDTVVLEDGRTLHIQTQVNGGVENMSLEVAGAGEKKGKVARAKEEIARKVEQTLAPFKGPGKMERAKEWLVGRLPVHPQYLHRGTVYTAELLAPIDFGTASPMALAPEGTAPAPGSVLTARLLTSISSAATPRGTPIQAVLTRPLFSDDNLLILPEGTELAGEVTFTKGARRLHRNGQLRFLFDSVRLPERDPQKMLASLHSVQVGRDEGVEVDEEGGARATSSKARFVAPALALLAARASVRHGDHDNDAFREAGPDGEGSNVGAQGVGGFIGLSLLGSALSQASRPVAVVLGAFGFVRTAYGAVFGKGREVAFPANTPMELQLPAARTER